MTRAPLAGTLVLAIALGKATHGIYGFNRDPGARYLIAAFGLQF